MLRIKWEKPTPKRSDSAPSWFGSLIGVRPAPVDKYGHTEQYYRDREKRREQEKQKALERLYPKEKTFLFGLIGRAKQERKKKVVYVDSRGRVIDPPRGSASASKDSKRPAVPTRSHTYGGSSLLDRDQYKRPGTSTPQKGSSTPQRGTSVNRQGTSATRQGTSVTRKPTAPPQRQATSSSTTPRGYSRRHTS